MGALLGLLLGGLLGARLTKQSTGDMMDGLGLALAPAILLLRLAENGTGLGVGLAQDKGWAAFGIMVQTEDGLMHAVWAYEAIAAALILVCVALTLCRKHVSGDGLLTFLLLFCASQVLL